MFIRRSARPVARLTTDRLVLVDSVRHDAHAQLVVWLIVRRDKWNAAWARSVNHEHPPQVMQAAQVLHHRRAEAHPRIRNGNRRLRHRVEWRFRPCWIHHAKNYLLSSSIIALTIVKHTHSESHDNLPSLLEVMSIYMQAYMFQLIRQSLVLPTITTTTATMNSITAIIMFITTTPTPITTTKNDSQVHSQM